MDWLLTSLLYGCCMKQGQYSGGSVHTVTLPADLPLKYAYSCSDALASAYALVDYNTTSG